MTDRYSRQVLFSGIGAGGQKKLAASYAAVVGCGALGTVIATSLVRAGVGRVRIIDRDFIEHHNLQRQVLFDEDDIREGLPKAVAAERHLRKVNSSVTIEGIVADVNFTNIEELVSGANVILDGLDNFEARFLINDVSLKHRIPWVYGGAISASGMTMNILPGDSACFRCLCPDLPAPGELPTCDTAGILGPAPFVIGSLQSAEALKILVGAKEISRELTAVDVWTGSFERLLIPRREDCPACHGRYEFLEGRSRVRTASLCGQHAVQVLAAQATKLSFKELAARLRSVGQVTYNDFMLHFSVDGHEMIIFPDGRAIVKNTHDESVARSLYTKYVGA